jgi:menaquinone-9 beta-reductase
VTADLVIVGGGPAGSAAACLLARHGRRPLLLERETGAHDKVCGDFVSVEAQAALAALGLDVEALGGARIRRFRLVRGRQVAEADLPFAGVGLSRRVLDEALLQRAAAAGADLRRGAAAREVVADGADLRVDLRGGEAVAARTVLLATGKHDLRRPQRQHARSPSDLIGFKTYLRLAPSETRALRDHVEIVLFRGGYAGLQMVEGGRVNLCLLVERTLFEALGRSWDALLRGLEPACPHLARRIDGADVLLDRPLAITRIPYGLVHRAEAGEPAGLFRLGDQLAVIPSFAGDGLAIALHTARLAARHALADGRAGPAFHRAAARHLRGQIRLASTLAALGRTRFGGPGIVAAGRACPALLRSLAALTRVPDRAAREAALGMPLR